MTLIADFNREEADILIHLINNKQRKSLSMSENLCTDLIDKACSNEEKIKLAKISEDEKFALKNRFKHQKDTMQYAKKENMPIDQMKVKDILRNQHIVRQRVNEEINTY
jgi:hypothetical protein